MMTKIKLLKIVFTDRHTKSWYKILYESIDYCWAKKEFTGDYFRKFLYRKDIVDYKNYLSLNQYYSIINSPKILKPEIASFLDNKLAFALYCEKNRLPVPKLISYNFSSHFFHNERSHYIKDKADLINFFNMVFKSYKTDHLFLKKNEGYGGSGCYLLKKNNLPAQIEDFGEVLMGANYIHQEVIVQHPAINKMFSKSINTLRLDVYLDDENNSHLISALMRFGIGNNIVDNTSSGGFFASVDIEKETLQGKGYKVIAEDGAMYIDHPDTKTKIDGFKIPYLKESIALAKFAIKQLPTKMIGWDIAITKNGPLIIEGNSNLSLHMTDMAYGGYCKHPMIQALLEKVNNQ